MGYTVIAREYARFAQVKDDPYYPIDTPGNCDLLSQYQNLAAKEPNIIFGGRLGQYKYMDMDITIHAALECFKTLPYYLLSKQ